MIISLKKYRLGRHLIETANQIYLFLLMSCMKYSQKLDPVCVYSYRFCFLTNIMKSLKSRLRVKQLLWVIVIPELNLASHSQLGIYQYMLRRGNLGPNAKNFQFHFLIKEALKKPVFSVSFKS